MGFFSLLEKGGRAPIKLILYLDVGRGNARSAIVQIEKNKPHILYTVLGEHKVNDQKEEESLVERSLTSLREVLEQTAKIIQKSSHRSQIYAAEEVYCILAAPYYLSHTSLMSYRAEKPFVVTPSIMKKVLNEGSKSVPIAHTDAIVSDNPLTIHEKIIDFTINGYHTNKPVGKSTEELQIAVFRSQISSQLFEGIHKIVKQYTSAPLFIEPLSLAAFVSLRNRIHNKDDFIFVAIGNEVTEVSLVHDQVLLETASFPFGKYSLARAVANKLSVTAEEALSRISLYHDGKLEKSSRDNLMPIIEGAQAEWFSYLERTLVLLGEETALPPDILIIVDTELKDIFGSLVTNESFASQSLVPHGFSVQTVDTALLADCCSFGLNIRFDTLLAVSASFAGTAKEVVPRLYPQKAF